MVSIKMAGFLVSIIKKVRDEDCQLINEIMMSVFIADIDPFASGSLRSEKEVCQLN